MPVKLRPSSGTWFHSLHATSQALQPMQIEVSVKNPIRGGWSTYPAAAAGSRPARAVSPVRPAVSAVISRLRPRLFGDAGPLLVVADQLAQRGPPGPAPWSDVAGERLDFLDVHVRVQGQVGQLVRRVAGRQAVRSPVPGQPDLV